MKKVNNLFILIGCPGSGKSTWCRKQQERLPHYYNVISRDDIRLSFLKEGEDYWAHETEVYNEFIKQIGESLKDPNRYTTIADASHLNRASRSKLLKYLDKRFPGLVYDVVFVYFDTPLEVCKERNSKRTGRRCVPEEVVEDMYSRTTFPMPSESKRLKRIEIIRE